jgi:plastocyanin
MLNIRAAALALALLSAPGIVHAAETSATIKLFQFQPGEITIKKGTTIVWVNGDDIEHSVTAGAPGKESGAFDSGFFKKDGSFRQTFTEAGTFDYFCKRHPSMKAKVVVTE